jgi:hypothetical protein
VFWRDSRFERTDAESVMLDIVFLFWVQS